MTKPNGNTSAVSWKAVLPDQVDLIKELVRVTIQEFLEAEMTETLQAERHERTGERRAYRSGYYERGLVTRVGRIELCVPQDRRGLFSTELFERYQRSEQALVLAMLEMFVQGVSTRKVRAVTEELCGHGFSASTISELLKRLAPKLEAFATRRLEQPYRYVILDARYERVREDGVVRSRAVLIALGINDDGRREVLAVELANRESATTWRDFLLKLKTRGLHGVEFVVSDSHEGLRRAVMELLPEAAWQRCYVHFLRNALAYLPRKLTDDCLLELRRLYDRQSLATARHDLGEWLAKWQAKYPKLCEWVEANIEETFTFYRLPCEHHKHLKSTNMLERLNEELKRRTLVVRIFPHAESCLRLVRALAVEIHEHWQESTRYLNMALLDEQKKQRQEARAAAAAVAA